MNVNCEIDDFEKVLKGYSAGKSLLYSDKNTNETSDGLKSIDVIKNVCKQIKDINNDETQKKSSDSKLKAFKKSSFVPVNMLSIEPQQKPGTSNCFETQYVFDTQLLTVIKDAEAIKDTRTGVTQEFETSFGQIVKSNTTQDNKLNNMNCEMSKFLTAESSKISSSCQELKQNFPSKSKCNNKAVNDNYLSDDSKKSLRNYISYKKELHRNKSTDELEVQNFIRQESEETSLSPILNSKKTKKTYEKSSITCMLESFEKFEAIAGPLVQENSNQKVVKEIINSRILNKILFLPDCNEDFINKNVEHPHIESEKQAISDELEEDILFSSDEESDYMQNQIKELPLTCALQTSFYKQEDVLDKTMYVGFQTASNRSIQVLTDSFSKAKNIFNNLHNGSKNSSTSLTVSELVQEYDSVLKQTKCVSENVKQNMDLFSQDEEKEVNKLRKVKKVTANEIQAGYKSAKWTLSNISDKPWLTNKVDNWKEDIYEHADKVEANIWTRLDGTHFNGTQEHINQNVRIVPDVASNSNISKTQAEINIDDCLMREFEDSLLCINDNKLHTNSETTLPSNTESCNSSELINIHRSFLNPKCGFKTASNKSIKISHKGITKMKNVFDDIDLNFGNNLAEKKRIIDENNCLYNLDKAGQQTQKELFGNKNNPKDDEDKVKCPPLFTKDISHYDIKFIKEEETDSNHPVNFPDEVLVKSKQNDENDNCKEKGPNNCIGGLTLFQGFKTASDKAVVISEKALVESNRILQEFDCKNNLIDNDINNAKYIKIKSKDITHYGNKLPKEYKTAINNDENISEEVLLKPKQMLNFDKLPKSTIDANCKEKEVNSFIKESTLFQGFRTASNKPIMISAKALAKSNEMLQEMDYQSHHKADDMDKATCRKQTTKSIKLYDRHSVKKNTTASNNPINFPDEPLTKSKRAFDFDELLDNNIDDNCKEKDLKKFVEEPRFFQGFRTASNKPVIISEKALEKSNKMLQEFAYQNIHKDNDIDKETYRKQSAINITNNDIKLVKENTRAANNPVNFPGEASAKSRVLDFNEILVNNIDDNFKQKEVNNFIKDTTSFQGFRTASNKPVTISEKALAKSNKMLQEFDYQSNHKADDIDKATCHKQLTKSITHYDIKLIEENTTASKNPENLLEEPSVKSKRVLEFNKPLNNNIEHICKKKKVNNFVNDSTLLLGFRTASDKPVIISEKALAKSNKMFQEIDYQNIHEDDNMVKEICRTQLTKNVTHHDGKLVKENTTAANNPVYFPGKALEKSQRVLDLNELFGKNMDDNYKEKEVNNFLKDSTLFRGFTTASNKPVIISEEALAQSNKMLQEFDYQSDHKGDDMNKATCRKQLTTDTEHLESNLAKDCTTDFNNQVNIPDANLVTSKQISDFGEHIDKNTNNGLKKEDNNNKKESTSFGEGFLAPSKKRVKNSNVLSPQPEVSQRHIPLQDYDNLSTSEKNNHLEMFDLMLPKKVFQGFKTANNNQVKVSEDAIARSKKMFEEINNYSDNLKIKNTNLNVMGFQTGNNKVARVSEEALQESKKIFEGIDDYLKTGTKQILKNDHTHRESTVFKTPLINNYNIKDISETRSLFTNIRTYKETVRPKNLINTDIDNIMNTEIIRDFEETMYTEDFLNNTPMAKRSGSPILSCPKAKRIKIRPTTNKEIVSDQNITKTDQYAFNTNYKKIKKYKLLDIYGIEKESKQIESSQGIYFDIDNILNFEFLDTRNGLSNERWTIEDVKNYFLGSVNKKIIPEGWVENHIKLILLKLISYERRFPNVMARVCSVNNIMDQLKYRYERELYNVERPALRKIFEKDEVPCRRILLKVLNIYIGGVGITSNVSINLSENIELLLSDGWYCIKTTIDKMLMKLVKEGKIVVGTKLITQGAELLNCEQGIAPWENTSSIRLKIFGNSTRRAHWTARLGFHDNSAPFVSYLTAVKPEGGKISQLRVVVTRVYPMLYVEKFDDGSTVTRSERLENLYQTKYETERETLLEKVYEEVEKEFTNQDSQDYESMDIDAKNLESGSQIYQLMKKSRDPSDFRAHLTHSQAKLLQEYTIKRRELSLHELQLKVQELLKKRGLNVVRNVVPMLKIRVADVYRNNVTKAVITVWRPNESLLNILREGSWVDIFNVIPTAVRYSELQISAGKQSVFRKNVKVQNQMTNVSSTLQRRCFKILELTNNPYLATDYNEVDTVGFVFDIKPSFKDFDSKINHFQNVFLADVNKKIICINFWGGLRKFGFEYILEIGQIVACVNLQKRLGNTRKNIPQYRATEFSYFTKTPKLETSKQLFDDLSKQFLSLDRRKFIQDCNIIRNNFDNIKHGNIENISPYRFNNSDYNISKNKAFINSPVGDTNLNLNWADFESSFKQTDTVLSPKTLLRKKEVSEKIARLKKYGEAPPLSSIHIVNKTKDAAKPYKSPLVAKNEPNITKPTNSKANNTIETKLISNIETSPSDTNLNASSDFTNNRCTSPVLPYRGRTVNPVKLNFSKKDMTKDDPFSEDFESSPPLSLD